MRGAPRREKAGPDCSGTGRNARPVGGYFLRDARDHRNPRRGSRAPFPNRSLRAFREWPQGLSTYLEIGYQPGVLP